MGSISEIWKSQSKENSRNNLILFEKITWNIWEQLNKFTTFLKHFPKHKLSDSGQFNVVCVSKWFSLNLKNVREYWRKLFPVFERIQIWGIGIRAPYNQTNIS